MPYAIRKIKGTNWYMVYNADTGIIKAYHTTKDRAERQVSKLMSLERVRREKSRVSSNGNSR